MNISSSPRLFTDYASPRRRQLLDETSKIIYDGPEPGTYVLYFKDDIALEKGTMSACGKGVLNNRISELLMTRLNDLRIETHFVRLINMREQLIRTTETLPFTLTLHNVASGTFAKRLGLEDGSSLLKPIPEFSLRADELNNPVVAAEHLTSLGWSRFEEIDDILLLSQRINDFLSGQFLAINIRLISFKLEFGRLYTSDLMDSQIVVTDEISPDTCNLLDLKTGKRLDRQGAQDNPEQAREIYQEVARRLGLLGLDAPEETMTSGLQDILASAKPSLKRSLNRRKSPNGHNSI